MRNALMARQSGYRLAEEHKRHGLTQAQREQKFVELLAKVEK